MSFYGIKRLPKVPRKAKNNEGRWNYKPLLWLP